MGEKRGSPQPVAVPPEGQSPARPWAATRRPQRAAPGGVGYSAGEPHPPWRHSRRGIGIIASIVGQIASQLLRRRGKVRCFVPHSRREPPRALPTARPNQYAVTFGFPLWFFNEKEVGIGIAELMMTFHKGGEELALALDEEKGSGTPLRTLDLPPRQWAF